MFLTFLAAYKLCRNNGHRPASALKLAYQASTNS